MIEEYIHKGYVPINKDTIIDWLNESLEFLKTQLTYNYSADTLEWYKNNMHQVQGIIETLKTGVRYESYQPYINESLRILEANRDYFKRQNIQTNYEDINIKLYNELQKLLNDCKDYYETQKGQIQFLF